MNHSLGITETNPRDHVIIEMIRPVPDNNAMILLDRDISEVIPQDRGINEVIPLDRGINEVIPLDRGISEVIPLDRDINEVIPLDRIIEMKTDTPVEKVRDIFAANIL